MKIFILLIINGNKKIAFLRSFVLFLTCQNIGSINNHYFAMDGILEISFLFPFNVALENITFI